MKRVIAGRVYNTETATEICELPCNSYRNDFGWHETSLYRTRNGNYFVAGEGNAASMWAQPCGNMSGPGRGIRPVSADEARDYAESAELDAKEMAAAGFALDDA